MRSEVQRELRLTQHSVWDAQGVAEVKWRGLKDLRLWIFSRFFAQLCPLASFLVSNRSRLEMIPTLLWVNNVGRIWHQWFSHYSYNRRKKMGVQQKMNLICVILLIRFLLVFNRNCQRPPSCQNLLPEPHTSQAPTVVGNFSTNLSWCNFSPPWVIFSTNVSRCCVSNFLLPLFGRQETRVRLKYTCLSFEFSSGCIAIFVNFGTRSLC